MKSQKTLFLAHVPKVFWSQGLRLSERSLYLSLSLSLYIYIYEEDEEDEEDEEEQIGRQPNPPSKYFR